MRWAEEVPCLKKGGMLTTFESDNMDWIQQAQIKA
jgi:hypothetical protein